MKQLLQWDRRRFVQMIGCSSMVGAVGSRFGWAAMTGPEMSGFAYVGGERGIHVYAVQGGRWTERELVPSANPVALAVSAGHLYVANGIETYGSLPRGTVEAYAIDPASGQLTLKNRAELSLSGTMPRHLAVAPDGRSLVVAVGGGGAYNVLSIEADGRLGRVSGILKETGSGPQAAQAAAHPEMVLFDGAGRLLAADLGADRLSVLALSGGELAVAGRSATEAGSGPSRIALDPSGRRLYVAHALDGSVACFGYNRATGTILGRQQVVAAAAGEMAAMAMHPSGDALYTAQGDGVRAWRIASDGALRALPAANVAARALHVTADGKSLLALSGNSVVRMKIDPVGGALAAPVKVADLPRPLSIAWA